MCSIQSIHGLDQTYRSDGLIGHGPPGDYVYSPVEVPQILLGWRETWM